MVRNRTTDWVVVAFLATMVLMATGVARAEGVTIITHGYSRSGSGTSAWLGYMRDDIAEHWLGGVKKFGTITVAGTAGKLTATCSPWNVDLSSSPSGEIIIILDWSAVADHLVTGIPAQDVAAAVTPKILQSQNGARPLAELPIHLIGHSRGGGLVCEIARLLGEQGVIVDQVTPLDPHPLTLLDPQPENGLPEVIDTSPVLYENVLFSDCLLQRLNYPMGQLVTGAYNREWTSLPGGYHDIGAYGIVADHLNIPLAYAATINLHSPFSNGEATLLPADMAAWFTPNETASLMPGRGAGFYYSRIAGHSDRLSTGSPNGAERPIDGYTDSPLVGGKGKRAALAWSSAVWPNLATIKILRGTNALGAGRFIVSYGETLAIELVGLDADSVCDATFYVDQDRNPYNGNNLATIGTQHQTAASPSFFNGMMAWDTSGLSASGSYYVYGAITDGSRTRYLYAAPEFGSFAAADSWMLYD